MSSCRARPWHVLGSVPEHIPKTKRSVRLCFLPTRHVSPWAFTASMGEHVPDESCRILSGKAGSFETVKALLLVLREACQQSLHRCHVV